MKIALVQMEIKEKQHAENTAHGLEMLEEAAGHCDLAILPEIWTTGYSLGHLQEQAETPGDELIRRLQDMAARHHCGYGKAHLFGMFHEEDFFASGDRFEVYGLNGVQCASTLCYDMRFPELYRYLALRNAQLILVPAQWPDRRGYAWDVLCRARAIENHLFLAAVNAVGTFKQDVFYGHSRLVDPNGCIIAEAGHGEEIVYADMDPARSEEVRKILNSLADVRLRISVPPFADEDK